jgi:hypothetical protein
MITKSVADTTSLFQGKPLLLSKDIKGKRRGFSDSSEILNHEFWLACTVLYVPYECVYFSKQLARIYRYKFIVTEHVP